MVRVKTRLGQLVLDSNYNNDTLTFKNMYITLSDRIASKEEEDKTSEYLMGFNTSTSYKDFVEMLREESTNGLPFSYLFYLDDGILYVFRATNYASKERLILKYKPENDKMLEYIKKVLYLNDSKNYAMIASNVESNFSIIAPWQVINVILSKEYVLSIGEKPFKTFKHTSKNGKVRKITAPHDIVKSSLQDLNELLQKVYDRRNENVQIAYKVGKNVVSGAKLHTNHKYIFNLDIHDFFPSCKRELVKKYTDFLFSYAFNREFIENEFLDSITERGGLFIGSPVSGTLANAIISKPVEYMVNICKKYDITVSVYADDITFSSNKYITKNFAEGIFKSAFSKYQLDDTFKINRKKSIGLTGMNRKITGVKINDSDTITVPGIYYRNLRSSIEHLAHNKSNVNVQKLRGQIAYATMVDQTGKVYRYLMKFEDTVKQYKLCSDEKLSELEEKFGGN